MSSLIRLTQIRLRIESAMNRYVPFLKFKQGEIMALAHLSASERLKIRPLIEIPRDDLYTSELLKKRIDFSAKKFKKYCPERDFTFYLDNYEVPDSITIGGTESYKYFLESLSDYKVIPVCGLDRTSMHNSVSVKFARESQNIIAIRVTPEYIKTITAYLKDIAVLFAELGNAMQTILLVDCRLVGPSSVSQLCLDIAKLITLFSTEFGVAEVVVAGSSLPASASMYMGTNSEIFLNRNEVSNFQKVKALLPEIKIDFGDYSIVSPDYSEINIDPRMMPNVMTARMTYSTIDSYYVIRGVSLKQGGYEQYFEIAKKIVGKPFYRGPDYSWGDGFLSEKSEGVGSNCTPSTIIAPTVNAHISFMLSQFAL